MRKGILKVAVLTGVFLLSVILFSTMTSHVNEDLTAEMPGATLPVVSLYSDGIKINELHGYTEKMNAAYMRDTITPIQESRKLPITILTNQKPIDEIRYEIRSLDTSRLVANAEVSEFKETKGVVATELQIQNLLEAGEEYLLNIQLQSGDEVIYFYTRITEAAGTYVDECLEFVLDFNEKTFQKENINSLAIYMEKNTGDNSSLHFVSLNSSIRQVGWGDFEVKKLTEPVPSIKEITDTYSIIILNYVVTAAGENGEVEYYNIEEYYRVRYTSERFYVLNFERSMNRIFRGESDNIKGQYINLGIRDKNVEFKNNEAGTIVAFVQEGELWIFDQKENTLAKVFSFRGFEGLDARENYGEHEIKIASIDETGSVDYVVYGYMNRGIHEGTVGMAVYHYDSVSNTNEEILFIPTDKSFDVLKSQIGQLMYVGKGRELFLLLDGTIYGVNLGTMETRELASGLTDESFASSESNRWVAWVEGATAEERTTIRLMDLMNQKTIEIKAGNDELVRPLGFMNEDFVYGVARESEVSYDAAGNVIFPMYQLKIASLATGEPEVIKTYEKNGYYVFSIEMDGYTMYLNRMQYNGTIYVEAERDMIIDREGDTGKLVDVHTSTHSQKKTEIQLSLAKKVSSKNRKLLTPKETILEDEKELVLGDSEEVKRYYVYAKGEVVLATDRLIDAIRAANEQMGVVIGEDQEYVWKRSRSALVTAFRNVAAGEADKNSGTIAKSISALLVREGVNIRVQSLVAGGETPGQILANTLKDVKVFELAGCKVEEVLYYINCGNPVFAMTGSDSAVLLIGYDATTVTIFDPGQNRTYRKPLADAEEMFAAAGSVFVSYLFR